MSKSSRRSNVNAREPMAQSSTAQLRSYHVGALPIINHFLEKLDLHNILEIAPAARERASAYRRASCRARAGPQPAAFRVSRCTASVNGPRGKRPT